MIQVLDTGFLIPDTNKNSGSPCRCSTRINTSMLFNQKLSMRYSNIESIGAENNSFKLRNLLAW